MDWTHLLFEIWRLLQQHWISWLVSLVFLAIGTWWGRRRARAEWSKKRFLDRINFSLNVIQDGRLLIRTLMEEDSRMVFLNDIAVQWVESACHRTTEENPILPLGKDRWFALNAVLNKLSERFAEGHIKRDLGISTQGAIYLICLTYENAGEIRTRKIRAMVIQKTVLLNLPADLPQLQQTHHITRYNTLKKMASSYAKDPADFLEVEICI